MKHALLMPRPLMLNGYEESTEAPQLFLLVGRTPRQKAEETPMMKLIVPSLHYPEGVEDAIF